MEAFVQQLISGLSSGSIYASLALALVMIYRSTHHVNFAQGEMAMFSTYLAWLLIDAGLAYWVAFAVTLVASFFGGVVIERGLIRRFSTSPVLSVVIVFVALLIIFNSTAGWLFDYRIRPFPSPFGEGSLSSLSLVSAHEAGALIVTLAVMALIYLFFRFTKLGLGMRAAAYNPVSSRLVGIRVDRMLALGWGLAAAVGAVAGMLAAPVLYLEPTMMLGVLLYGLAAALLGGIDNPWGAVFGGFVVGVLENLLGAYVVGTELKLSVALAIIVLILIVKPNGLFGRKLVTRV